MFHKVEFPGARQTVPTGIDDKQDVVGYYYDDAGEHGFVLSNGAYTSVDFSGANNMFEIDAVGATGIASGHYSEPGVAGFVGFTYDLATGRLTNLDFPAGDYVYPGMVTANGKVVGAVYDMKSENSAFKIAEHVQRLLPTVPGIEKKDLAIQANSINLRGIVAGEYAGDSGSGPYHGFTFLSGSYTTIDVPGASETVVEFIRDDGAIAGGYYVAPKTTGFVRIGGTFQTFSLSGAQATYALRLTKVGQAIGFWADSEGDDHGFVWQAGTITDVDVPGAKSTDILGINARGEFVGYYTKAGEKERYPGFVALCFAPPCTQ